MNSVLVALGGIMIMLSFIAISQGMYINGFVGMILGIIFLTYNEEIMKQTALITSRFTLGRVNSPENKQEDFICPSCEEGNHKGCEASEDVGIYCYCPDKEHIR